MNALQTILILAGAFVAVFCQTSFPLLCHWFGAQIDLLPALMVCAALNTDLVTVGLLAVFGGLCFDSVSANPFGISVAPLFVVGFLVFTQRELILRELPFAQIVLGAAASAIVPVITVLLLLSGDQQPLIGWGSLWQWLVMTAGGALATPVLFKLLNWSNRAFGYQPRTETSFRPDREIRRDRKLK
ncbi:MAG TPA: hypothetical protein VHG71_10380 [Verrucomicrobiae bacterium]|nr:hypothetical protein [Verrucomicrobiae bacterium]